MNDLEVRGRDLSYKELNAGMPNGSTPMLDMLSRGLGEPRVMDLRRGRIVES